MNWQSLAQSQNEREIHNGTRKLPLIEDWGLTDRVSNWNFNTNLDLESHKSYGHDTYMQMFNIRGHLGKSRSENRQTDRQTNRHTQAVAGTHDGRDRFKMQQNNAAQFNPFPHIKRVAW